MWTDLLLWLGSPCCALHRLESLLYTDTRLHASLHLHFWRLAGLRSRHWSLQSHSQIDPLRFHLVSMTKMRLVDWPRYHTAGQAWPRPLLQPPLSPRVLEDLIRTITGKIWIMLGTLNWVLFMLIASNDLLTSVFGLCEAVWFTAMLWAKMLTC